MPPKTPPPRIHIITARDEPVAVILRRGPSKWCNLLCYNTDTDELESGSWFNGRIYEHRCDLSPDGRHMVYLAMGNKGQTWNGICEPPRLTCLAQWATLGSWFGGGVWKDSKTLAVNLGAGTGFHCGPIKLEHPTDARLQITYIEMTSRFGGEDEGVLYERLERDGWQRQGPFGKDVPLPGNQYRVAHEGDSGWLRQGEILPDIRLYYRGYFSGKGRSFEFTMPGHPDVLTPEVEWATIDNRNSLLVARNGHLERWGPTDIERRSPAYSIDLSQFTPPVAKPDKS